MLPHALQFASKDEEDRVYIACGRAAMNWGPLELSIESIMIRLRYKQHCDRNEPFPMSFNRKTEEIKKRLNAPRWVAFKPEATKLLSEAKTLHASRSIIVHGIFHGTSPGGYVMFGVSDHKNRKAYLPKNFSLEAISALSDDMARITSSLGALSSAIAAQQIDAISRAAP